MSELPPCPSCAEEITYPDRENYVCASCGHEWAMDGSDEVTQDDTPQFRDANGTPLQDGDSCTLIKDLKVKGSSMVLQVGTRIDPKSTRLNSSHVRSSYAGFCPKMKTR